MLRSSVLFHVIEKQIQQHDVGCSLHSYRYATRAPRFGWRLFDDPRSWCFFLRRLLFFDQERDLSKSKTAVTNNWRIIADFRITYSFDDALILLVLLKIMIDDGAKYLQIRPLTRRVHLHGDNDKIGNGGCEAVGTKLLELGEYKYEGNFDEMTRYVQADFQFAWMKVVWMTHAAAIQQVANMPTRCRITDGAHHIYFSLCVLLCNQA